MEKGRKDFFLGEAAASCSFLLGVLELKTIDPSYMYISPMEYHAEPKMSLNTKQALCHHGLGKIYDL